MIRRNQPEAALQRTVIQHLRWGLRAPIRPEQDSEHIDDRLLFLVRAHARLILVEADEITLDEALEGLVEPICECQRWPLAAQWERTHPPRREYRRRRGRT